MNQDNNSYIFLHFQQIFVNSGPMLLELVAVSVGPDFYFLFMLWSATAKKYLFTFGIVLRVEAQQQNSLNLLES